MHSLFKGVIITFGLVLASCTPVPPCPAVTQDDAKKAEVALADFAVNLYKNVASKDENKNQIVSPVSITLALALLENGADTKTRDQLRQALVQSQQVDVLKTYRSVQELLRIDDGKTKLSIANGLFKAQDLKLKDDYQSSTQNCLNAKLDDADFKNQLEQSRQKINQYVAQQTNNKIPELFKQGVLTQQDLMVLANALYLNSTWQVAFDKTETKQHTFYKNGQDQQTVQFMQQSSESHRHVSLNDLDALELSYQNKDLSMVIVLPKQRDGLLNLEKRITGKELRDIISQLGQKQVQVQLPKFNARTSVDLKNVLINLGLDQMFSNNADFSRMSETPLMVSSAVHEAYINIDEQGTEAAAATGESMKIKAVLQPPVQTSFVADHPFLYAIVHKPTGAIVFLGKITSIDQQ